MSYIKLSICIPTYNFGMFIGDTLKSIVDQAHDDVDVIILDGGSTDNTQEIVADFRKLFPWITYHRLNTKGGIDKDMARTLDLAQGEYCWLMSSDDVIKPGAIRRILDEIKRGYDIYLCNRTECDRDMKPVRDRLWLSNNVEDQVFTFSTPADLINYFDKARSIGALFSYMSSIIVRRDRWNAIQHDSIFIGSHYAHVFRLFSILQNGGSLNYIKEPLVLCRGDNDSFLESGQFNRYSIDIDGYLLLASRLFSDTAVRNSFLAVMRREFKWYEFVALRKSIPDNSKWNDFERKLIAYGYSRATLFAVRFISSSRFIYSVFRFFWQILSSIMSGTNRFAR